MFLVATVVGELGQKIPPRQKTGPHVCGVFRREGIDATYGAGMLSLINHVPGISRHVRAGMCSSVSQARGWVIWISSADDARAGLP